MGIEKPPTSTELVRYIDASSESSNVDAKAPILWDGGPASADLSKDFAAFANSKDGGTIVIGKSETSPGKFVLVGLSKEEADSFDTTKVSSWVNQRFSPPISLTCHRVEYKGMTFV